MGLLLPPALDLTGRTALVTGAGSPSGIGMACARLLAACGAAVVVAATTDRAHERAAELADAGHVAAGVVADLTTEEGAAGVVATALGLGGEPRRARQQRRHGVDRVGWRLPGG